MTQKRIVRRNFTLATIVSGLVILSVLLPVSFSSASPKKPVLTLSRLEAYIAASSKISKVQNLNKTIPPLQYDVSDGLTLTMKYPCFGDGTVSLPSNPERQCVWGDTKSQKSIFLFGDSQAAAWLAAFNQIGIMTGYKVYFLAEASCPPWEPSTGENFTITTGITLEQCVNLVADEIQFANTIHPALVVLSGDGTESGENEYGLTSTDYQNEISTVISSLGPSGSKVVLLSEAPQYFPTATNPMTPELCLTVHGGDVVRCLLSPSDVTGLPISEGLGLASTATNTPLINVLPLFCTSTLCPETVATPQGVFLVHFDQYHIDKFYAAYIAPALLQEIDSSVHL